mgnify:CR=1 FL=1
MKAADRAFDDPVVPLAKRNDLQGRCSQALLASIDKAMSPKASDRFQKASDWLMQMKAAKHTTTKRTSRSLSETKKVPTSEDRKVNVKRDALISLQAFSSHWYYKKASYPKSVFGPISLGLLIAKIKAGQVGALDWVWNGEDGGDWRRVVLVPQLAAARRFAPS